MKNNKIICDDERCEYKKGLAMQSEYGDLHMLGKIETKNVDTKLQHINIGLQKIEKKRALVEQTCKACPARTKNEAVTECAVNRLI